MEQDINELSQEELEALVEMTDDKEVLRQVATLVGATYSGNTGVAKLKESAAAAIPMYFARKELEEAAAEEKEAAEVIPSLPGDTPVYVEKPAPKGTGIPSIPELLEMNEFKEKNPLIKRAIVRAKALRLIRCRITNMDPNDAMVPGMILSLYNKYTGKVSKLIPFGDENEHGYHLPKMLFDELNSRTYNLRKEIKNKGSQFGIKQYKTIKVKKFNLEVLEDLTAKELEGLAQRQAATGSIDHSE